MLRIAPLHDLYDSTDINVHIIDWIFIVDNRSACIFLLVIKPLSCVEHNYRSSSQPTGMQYRLTAPPHGLYSYGCQLWNTIQLLRTQSSGKRLNDDDGFHFSTSILRFCLQTSRPCLKPHSSSINSKRFVDTTFVSISLSNHISCVTTRYSWSFWFPDKSRPLSHLGLRQLKNEIQETSI